MKAGGAKDDNVHAGYILGAGAEYMFTDRVSGVVQYLHRRDGAKTYSVLPASRSTTMVTNEIRIGINYHF
jgi:outer membrane immunogenic protein